MTKLLGYFVSCSFKDAFTNQAPDPLFYVDFYGVLK